LTWRPTWPADQPAHVASAGQPGGQSAPVGDVRRLVMDGRNISPAITFGATSNRLITLWSRPTVQSSAYLRYRVRQKRNNLRFLRQFS